MKIDWKKWLLIILGTISWSWTMVKSGWIYKYGMGFWGANGHDGVWHIALIESLSKESLKIPIFAGTNIQNYHIGFDLIMAGIHKLTLIPVVNLYFQIVPPILAILVGALTYKFVFDWTKSKNAANWSLFFIYFGGSFGWLIGKGESTFWSQQAVSSLINPPFAMSLVFILSGMIFLQSFLKTKKIRYLILGSIFFGILTEIKIYAGVLVIGGLFVSGVFEWLVKKRTEVLKIFAPTFLVSLVLFLLFEKGSGSLLVWQPFWFLETMMGLTDRLGWLKYFSAMMTYKSGHIWFKLIPAYFVALVIFYVGNLGIRIIKELLVWKWIKNFKEVSWIEVFSSSILVAGVLIPMFVLQKGTPWNTIQFFYYSLFFSGILAGVAIAGFLESSKLNTFLRYSIGVGIVLLTLPTTIITLKDVYIPSRPPAMLTNDELSALKFLSTQPDGVVLTFPFDPIASKLAEPNPPRPLYLYVSTAYVSAFSKHQTFLEDEINLDITGYDWQSRLSGIKNWYKEPDQAKAREFLKTNNIKYIYWVKPQRTILGDKQLGLTKILENATTIVYRVD